MSVTRLRLRSWLFLPAFAYHAVRSRRQAESSPGNRGAAVRKTAGLTFWTLTAWDDADAMAAFRRAPPHRDVMAKLKDWCDEGAYAHWEHPGTALPAWDEAARQLQAGGRLSHVIHPSADQKAGRIATS